MSIDKKVSLSKKKKAMEKEIIFKFRAMDRKIIEKVQEALESQFNTVKDKLEVIDGKLEKLDKLCKLDEILETLEKVSKNRQKRS